MSTLSPLPKILIITGHHDGTFAAVCKHLLESLEKVASITRSQDPLQINQLLLSGDISSVLVVDPTLFLLSQLQYRILRDTVRQFARTQGGTILFCGIFNSFVRPTDINYFFKPEWNLPWRSGDYCRTSFSLNPGFRLDDNGSPAFDPKAAGLDTAYSEKALHIEGMAKSSMLYVTTPDSQLESLVFAARPQHNEKESPVVFQTYGKGRVGWIGDVNGEKGSTKVVLGICGLSSGSKLPTPIPATQDPHAGRICCTNCGKREEPEKKFKRCGSCQVCYYCNAACQKAHWKSEHKGDCKYIGANEDKEDLGLDDDDEEDFSYYGPPGMVPGR
ncbi:MAG: hypothetical protein MMC33_009733 [Icmadophila ericetorum]|nr:hypothetical protein [Icmadophila ericetorum]